MTLCDELTFKTQIWQQINWIPVPCNNYFYFIYLIPNDPLLLLLEHDFIWCYLFNFIWSN